MDRIIEENCGTKISIASAIYGVKPEDGNIQFLKRCVL
jgi:hypothetical protein